MTTLYVCDTNSIVDYFHEVFGKGCALSGAVKAIFSEALCSFAGDVRLSVPAVVFVEVFDKWCQSEEFARKFHYEVYQRIIQSPNIEIRPVDRELLERVVAIEGNLAHHEMHDKLILASAMVLRCTLISCDTEIQAYNQATHAIPNVIY